MMADPKELLLGGLAACGAGFFTNPLEVVKTRIQLQGELRSRGQYTVHYKNVFHAFYVIGKTEGIWALQKGLLPGLYYQFVMNGVRLGVFQMVDNAALTRNSEGQPISGYTIVAGALAGATGAALASPFYQIKVHLQAQANSSIAVGYQHKHESFNQAFISIFKTHGLKGLWRGTGAQTMRVTAGSAAQLGTFTKFTDIFDRYSPFPKESILNTISSSLFSGTAVVLVMTPFDVVSTRLFNQPIDKITRKGLHYNGIVDCFCKIFRTEGFFGFYKGLAASWLRVGPHTVLTFLFWREIRKLYFSFEDKLQNKPVITSESN